MYASVSVAKLFIHLGGRITTISPRSAPVNEGLQIDISESTHHELAVNSVHESSMAGEECSVIL